MARKLQIAIFEELKNECEPNEQGTRGRRTRKLRKSILILEDQ